MNILKKLWKFMPLIFLMLLASLSAYATTLYPPDASLPLAEDTGIILFIVYDNGALKQNTTYTYSKRSVALLTTMQTYGRFEELAPLNFGNGAEAKNTPGEAAYIARLIDVNEVMIRETPFDPQKGNPEFKEGLVRVYVPAYGYLAKVEFYGPDGTFYLSMDAPDYIKNTCNKNGVCDRGETSNFCEVDCPRPPESVPTPTGQETRDGGQETRDKKQETETKENAQLWFNNIPKPYLYGGVAGALVLALMAGITVSRKKRGREEKGPNVWEQ